MIEFKGQRILKDIPCTFMTKRSTLGCIHWLEFVYTECHHDIILTLCHSNRSTCCDFSLCPIFYGNFDTPCSISRSRPCTLLPQTNFWNCYNCLRIFHEKENIFCKMGWIAVYPNFIRFLDEKNNFPATRTSLSFA